VVREGRKCASDRHFSLEKEGKSGSHFFRKKKEGEGRSHLDQRKERNGVINSHFHFRKEGKGREEEKGRLPFRRSGGNVRKKERKRGSARKVNFRAHFKAREGGKRRGEERRN